jgi:competence protein ComEC
MIVQHPMLWCAVFLAAGIAIGLTFPYSYLYLPLLVIAVTICTFLRNTEHWHDVLTLSVWLLLGCSRAAICSTGETEPTWQSTIEQKAKSVQTTMVMRLKEAGLSPRTLALCSALTIGYKDELKRETRQAYNKVGASHLLALSGMHLGIVYALLYFLLIRGVRHTRWRWHTLPIILLCLWGYALVAGMPVSLVRAAIMLSIFTIISLMQYSTDPLHPLALSAIIILLITPTDLLSISFQLSFAAVFFLLALWTPLSENFPKLPWAVKILAVSCVAQLGTMPLTLYYFHQLPLLAPLLSLLLIPLTTLIIYLVLVTMVLPFASLGWILNVVEALQQRIIDLAADIPCGTLTDIYLSATEVVLMYGVMLLAIVRLRTR